MTTMLMYKNFLLADCDNARNKQNKLSCIEGNVPLKIGRVNYMSYRGKRKQINICRKLRNIKGCTHMCHYLFEFYPEPSRNNCNFVKSKWVTECNLRVDLIEQKAKG